MSLLLDTMPVAELRVELFATGGFDRILRGTTHTKTCPHAIFAQATQGHYEITCGDGRHIVLDEGEAFLTGAHIPLHIVHHGDPKDGFRMRAHWLHMHYTLLDTIDIVSLLDLPLRVPAEECMPFAGIIREMRQANKRKEMTFTMKVRRQELALRALRLLCEVAPVRPDAVELLHQKDRLQPVLGYMRSNLGKRVLVADLAREACLSVPRFHAWFRQLTGRPPMEYLKQLRLAEACRLLVGTDLSLKEVAADTGFCNQFHFSRDFCKAFGKPPGRWRREYDPKLV